MLPDFLISNIHVVNLVSHEVPSLVLLRDSVFHTDVCTDTIFSVWTWWVIMDKIQYLIYSCDKVNTPNSSLVFYSCLHWKEDVF